MISGPLRHPESDLLLQFLDGELSRSEARRIGRHVEACWQCRAELDELRKLVAGCVRYRESSANAATPPPKAWADLSREFELWDDSQQGISWFRHTALRWALLGAGAVSLVAASLAFHIVDFGGSTGTHQSETRPEPKKESTAQSVSPASTIPRADGVLPSVPGRAPALEAKGETTASASDELRAVAVLHRLGADLGEPVEIARSGAYVLVGGTGVAPELQRQIHEALASDPKVSLKFTEAPTSAPAPSPDVPSRSAQAASNRAAGAPSPLEATLGGRAQLEKLSAQLLEHDDAAMARVYALRRLSEEFPADAERQLNSQDQRLLKDLSRQHTVALAQETAALDGLAFPLLPTTTELVATAGAASWQQATENLFVAARRVETLLPAWLGITAPDHGASTGGPPADVPRQLSAALAQFQAEVQQCERLLKP